LWEITVLNKPLLIILFLFSFNFLSAQQWKEMINDPSINVYEVVAEAESYFQNIDKNAKGSGWKKYQRWLYENEPKFYPSGDRSNVDPYFVSKEFKNFLKNNSKQEKSLFDNGWEELGPYYIEQVTGHYAVGLGRVESFYSDPNDSNRIYLGSRSGGFWRTIDGGNSWTNTTDFLYAAGVNTIAVSPNNPNHVLINVRNSNNGVTHGIYQSQDGGDTWNITNFNPDNLGWGGLGTYNSIYKIVYHPTIPDLVFIGTSEGLFRSTDNLNTWTNSATGNSWEWDYDFTQINFHPTDENIIYAATYNENSKIYISNDGGLTFSDSNTISGNSSNIKLSVSAACTDCIYVGSSSGVWKSTDNGQNFTLISNPGISNYGAFAVSDVDTNYMLFGDIDTHISSDEGLTFNQVTYWSTGNANYNTTGTYVHADIRGSRSENGVFWVNTDGFLCKSLDNGATWQIYEGQSIRENYCLGLSQSNHERTISGSQDNGTSIKTENSWIEFYGADGMEGIIHPLNDDWMIGSFQFGGKRRTKDGGLTQGGINPSGFDGNWIAPLLYDPNNQMRIFAMDDMVYSSDDFGSSWEQRGTPSFSGDISRAAIAENNSNILVVSNYQAIEKSIDGGYTYTDIKGSLPNQFITDIAFDPNDDNVIVVTYGNYNYDNNKVFITIDQGASWQNITYNLGNIPVRSVVIDHTDASTIYLGTEIGVYKKSMSENSWTLYNQDLPNMSVLELEIMYGSNTLRAATWGRGLWEFTLDGRQSFPSILTTRITNQPTDTQPKVDIDQFVTSTISYDGEIANVYIQWSTDISSVVNTTTMINTSDITWVTDSPIPNQTEGTKVYFKVFAEGDNNDITETYRYMYEVKANVLCTPSMDCSYNDGFQLVQVGDINNPSGCEGYGDFMDLSTDLEQGSNNQMTVTTGYGDQHVKVWIDYNDDLDFTSDEVVIDNYVIAPGQAAGSYTETIDFVIPENATLGEHILRAKTNWSGDVPADACDETQYGETEDYMVNIIESSLGLIENNFEYKPLVYPNPTVGNLSIDLGIIYNNVSITLTDINGRIIQFKNNLYGRFFDLEIDNSSGMYLLIVESEKNKAVIRIIKN
jgi:hypothetical protein